MIRIIEDNYHNIKRFRCNSNCCQSIFETDEFSNKFGYNQSDCPVCGGRDTGEVDEDND